VDVVVLNRPSVGLLYFIDKLDVVSLDRPPLSWRFLEVFFFMADIFYFAVRVALRYFNVLLVHAVVMLVAYWRSYRMLRTRRATCCETFMVMRIVTSENFVYKKNDAVADKSKYVRQREQLRGL